jgi:hypothetical protein
MSELVNNILSFLPGMIFGKGEGNISWYPERVRTLQDLVYQIKPKNIIEIGFNEGHSMVLICETLLRIINEKPDFNKEPIRIFIFDDCKYDNVVNNHTILSEYYKKWNIHITLFPGNSLDVVPRVLDTAKIKFDFIEIDGCHFEEYVRGDINNVINFINDNGIIYLDDYKSSKDPTEGVDNAIESFDWYDFNTYYIDGVFWAHKKKKEMEEKKEQVNHPNHYGGESNPYEAIKVIDAWDLGFSLGNTVKYISRAGKKESDKELQDLKKALWYLQHYIETLEKK